MTLFDRNPQNIPDVPNTAAATVANAATEPPRDSRRLHFLRGWSNEDIEEVSC